MVRAKYWIGNANVAEIEGTLVRETKDFILIRRRDDVEVRLGRPWIIEMIEEEAC